MRTYSIEIAALKNEDHAEPMALEVNVRTEEARLGEDVLQAEVLASPQRKGFRLIAAASGWLETENSMQRTLHHVNEEIARERQCLFRRQLDFFHQVDQPQQEVSREVLAELRYQVEDLPLILQLQGLLQLQAQL